MGEVLLNMDSTTFFTPQVLAALRANLVLDAWDDGAWLKRYFPTLGTYLDDGVICSRPVPEASGKVITFGYK